MASTGRRLTLCSISLWLPQVKAEPADFQDKMQLYYERKDYKPIRGERDEQFLKMTGKGRCEHLNSKTHSTVTGIFSLQLLFSKL